MRKHLIETVCVPLFTFCHLADTPKSSSVQKYCQRENPNQMLAENTQNEVRQLVNISKERGSISKQKQQKLKLVLNPPSIPTSFQTFRYSETETKAFNTTQSRFTDGTVYKPTANPFRMTFQDPDTIDARKLPRTFPFLEKDMETALSPTIAASTLNKKIQSALQSTQPRHRKRLAILRRPRFAFPWSRNKSEGVAPCIFPRQLHLQRCMTRTL